MRVTRLHSVSLLGSNTTQLVFALIDSSMKMNRRRTLRYFHSPFELIVRAYTRMPGRGSARIRMTPIGLRISPAFTHVVIPRTGQCSRGPRSQGGLMHAAAVVVAAGVTPAIAPEAGK